MPPAESPATRPTPPTRRRQANRHHPHRRNDNQVQQVGLTPQPTNKRLFLMSKTKRNAPCPCGSGKKFKKCHGANSKPAPAFDPTNPPLAVKQKIEALEAKEKQRQQQQGYGRPIISTTYQGHRVVAVGGTLHFSKSWKTFHDFLMQYPKHSFGASWAKSEFKKPFDDRHPLLQWYKLACREQQKMIKEPGKVHSAPMTGAMQAYLRLAYNLYLIDHNVPGWPDRDRLISRLKDPRQFLGAVYETYVAAAFTRAGFEIHYEDETDGEETHCEFVATSPTRGNSYSVEAKTRQPNKDNCAVGNQLYKALQKKADHTRVIFIEVNVPEGIDGAEEIKWFDNVLQELHRKEEKLTIDKAPAPPAYVFITNHPYQYNLTGTTLNPSAVAEGFKIPDFKVDSTFSDLHSALIAREKHADMLLLMDSIREHYRIPATFDGEIPEFAFSTADVPRLEIGKRYIVPDGDGNEQQGELIDAVVFASDRSVYGLYRLDDGGHVMCKNDMTDQEYEAYRQHPDTFFGRHKPKNKGSSPLDLYDFFYDTYQNSSKEQLLGFMQNHHDVQELEAISQAELAKLYCERIAMAAWNESHPPRPDP